MAKWNFSARITDRYHAAIRHAKKLQVLYESDLYISFNDLSVHRKTSVPPMGIFLSRLFHPFSEKSIRKSVKTLRKLTTEASREHHNKAVVQTAQQKSFTIEGLPLDTQQIEAVVVTEDAQLVMAAAGSGKTLSLLAKCEYLVNTLGIQPQRVLTISFTKASADELAHRLQNLGIAVDGKTFHALGNAIVNNGTRTILDQTDQYHIIETIIKDLLGSDERFARRYNNYLLRYFSAPRSLLELTTLEQIVRNNQTFPSYTLKPVPLDKRKYAHNLKTHQGEQVRSKEEQIIANFLYINQIEYEYEKPFPGYGGYRPDFTITTFGEPIYLEHQGVDRHGKTRPDINAKDYARKMQWNHDYHKKGGTRLIETFSYEFSEGTILKNLEKQLRKQGVAIRRRQEADITRLIHTSYTVDTAAFHKLIITYMGLLKTSDLTLSDVQHRVQSNRHRYQKRRTEQFLYIFKAILKSYEAHLASTNSFDFSDMIVDAAETLPQLAAGVMNYDYILVDEVQDLSGARYRLLKALLDRNPGSKLFAVGDDWQSIFRFAGSDLTLLSDFDERFGRHTAHSVIEQTHRFNDPLLGATTTFIKKNKTQVQKTPYSTTTPSQLRVNRGAERQQDAVALDSELRHLIDTEGTDAISRRSIFILARYKKDLERIVTYHDPRFQFRVLTEDTSTIEWTDTRTGFTLRLQFMTMHSSKGLTCDHAFVLNANGGPSGIPADRENDPVLQLLLAHEETFPHAEERRLFYVALTRAKRSTTVLCTPTNPSPFVEELSLPIEDSLPELSEPRCPACSIGFLIRRNGKYGDFYGCSNYGYGCWYTGATY